MSDCKGLECIDNSPSPRLLANLQVGDLVMFSSRMLMDRSLRGSYAYHAIRKATSEDSARSPKHPVCRGTVLTHQLAGPGTLLCPDIASPVPFQYRLPEADQALRPGTPLLFTPLFGDKGGLQVEEITEVLAPPEVIPPGPLGFRRNPLAYLSKTQLKNVELLEDRTYAMLQEQYGINAHPLLPTVATGLPLGGHPKIISELCKTHACMSSQVTLDQVDARLASSLPTGANGAVHAKDGPTGPLHCLLQFGGQSMALWLTRLAAWLDTVKKAGKRRVISLLYPIHPKTTVGNFLNTHSSRLFSKRQFPDVCRIALLPPVATFQYDSTVDGFLAGQQKRFALVTLDTAMHPDNFPAVCALEFPAPGGSPGPIETAAEALSAERSKRSVLMAFAPSSAVGRTILSTYRRHPSVQVSAFASFSPTSRYERAMVTFPSEAAASEFLRANRQAKSPVFCAPAADLFQATGALTVEVHKEASTAPLYGLTQAAWLFPVTDYLFRFRSQARVNQIIPALRTANQGEKKLQLCTLRSDEDELWHLSPRLNTLGPFTPPRVPTTFAGTTPSAATAEHCHDRGHQDDKFFTVTGFPCGASQATCLDLLQALFPSGSAFLSIGLTPLCFSFRLEDPTARLDLFKHLRLPLSPLITLHFSPCSQAPVPLTSTSMPSSVPAASTVLKATESNQLSLRDKKKLKRSLKHYDPPDKDRTKNTAAKGPTPLPPDKGTAKRSGGAAKRSGGTFFNTLMSKGKKTQPKKGKGKNLPTTKRHVLATPNKASLPTVSEGDADQPSHAALPDHNHSPDSASYVSSPLMQADRIETTESALVIPGSGRLAPRDGYRSGKDHNTNLPPPATHTPLPDGQDTNVDDWVDTQNHTLIMDTGTEKALGAKRRRPRSPSPPPRSTSGKSNTSQTSITGYLARPTSDQ